MFTKAIVRIPGSNFAEGLTTVDLGVPHLEAVLKQHAAYCQALQQCGLALTTLEADLRFPDSTFVEDTAILTPRGAIVTRPGAPSRAGEVAAIRELFPGALEIHAPERSMAAISAKPKIASFSACLTARTKKASVNLRPISKASATDLP